MSSESPLESARRRIAARSETPTPPIVEQQHKSQPDIDPGILDASQNDYLRKIPKPLLRLIQDVKRTIKDDGNIPLVTTIHYDFSTTDPKQVSAIIERKASPIRSIAFTFSGTRTYEGKSHLIDVYGPEGQIPQKDPDTKYQLFLKFTYHDQENRVDWVMGNVDGPEILNNETMEEKRNRENVTTYTTPLAGYAKGSISYSDENLEKLAEDLVPLLDSGRYKFVVHERPAVRWTPQGA